MSAEVPTLGSRHEIARQAYQGGEAAALAALEVGLASVQRGFFDEKNRFGKDTYGRRINTPFIDYPDDHDENGPMRIALSLRQNSENFDNGPFYSRSVHLLVERPNMGMSGSIAKFGHGGVIEHLYRGTETKGQPEASEAIVIDAKFLKMVNAVEEDMQRRVEEKAMTEAEAAAKADQEGRYRKTRWLGDVARRVAVRVGW